MGPLLTLTSCSVSVQAPDTITPSSLHKLLTILLSAVGIGERSIVMSMCVFVCVGYVSFCLRGYLLN